MSLKRFQEKIGADNDGIFGKETLVKAMEYYKLTPERTAHFFGQIAHESGNFRWFSENLNYSDKALLSVFGKYFTEELAEEYARNPEKIANRVYANRMKNGDEQSGDGWKYRGRGALQLTGRANYELFSEFLGDEEILENPDLVAEEYSFESALFFFESNNLWDICDQGITDEAITKLTKRINGGTHGLDDRIEKTKKFAQMLGIS